MLSVLWSRGFEALQLLECASMRLRVTTLAVIATIWMVLAFAAASAETIHLKNGRTILADHVRENGNRCEYDIGEDTYAIPRSSVERIEAGGAPLVAPSSANKKSCDVPIFIPADTPNTERYLSCI